MPRAYEYECQHLQREWEAIEYALGAGELQDPERAIQRQLAIERQLDKLNCHEWED